MQHTLIVRTSCSIADSRRRNQKQRGVMHQISCVARHRSLAYTLSERFGFDYACVYSNVHAHNTPLADRFTEYAPERSSAASGPRCVIPTGECGILSGSQLTNVGCFQLRVLGSSYNVTCQPLTCHGFASQPIHIRHTHFRGEFRIRGR